ncbi:hypothetical protein OS493_000688 [Desmophyllum pertusum]|uniref:Uncharacterized protein n=1 Tax=Desmophyllum pertusum TaxID=174260 RepID=A0A9X0A7X5_9CNID|nr:hypothetical protein OS493_000688 [Desmophyllum pertusum]
MEKLGYTSYRGKVSKRDTRSKFTFSYKCKARAFINTLVTNEFFKCRLLRQMKKVIEFLADPYCELFRPLTIDYDLIEVNHGTCWSLKERDFIEDAIEAHQIGKVSPRAFCPYEPTQEVPDAKYFREILENSLSQEAMCRFCGDFIKLLEYNKKKHKDKPRPPRERSNGNQTARLQQVDDHTFTEVIFIDEATETTLDIDDWKTLTQGGFSAHDVKYQSAKSFINRCPMLIISQRRLNFGPSDQPAMERRLNTYDFKSLPNPKKSACSWLKKHPMECLIWATDKAKNEECDEEDQTETDEEQSIFEDGILKDNEKEELRALFLDEAMDENTVPIARENNERFIDSESDDSQSGDVVQVLEDQLRQLQPQSLRHRQVSHILQAESSKKHQADQMRQKQHKQRKAWLKEKGVSTQNVELLPSDPEERIPTVVARDLRRYEETQMAARKEARQEVARNAFDGTWIRATETELKECCGRYQASDDQSVRSNLKAYIQTLCDKLKDHHLLQGMFGTAEAVAERKRVCTSLGLLSEKQQHLVTNVADRLPMVIAESAETEKVQEYPGRDASWDEEVLYITQVSTTRKCKDLSRSQGGAKKQKNTITHYFSQK